MQGNKQVSTISKLEGNREERQRDRGSKRDRKRKHAQVPEPKD